MKHKTLNTQLADLLAQHPDIPLRGLTHFKIESGEDFEVTLEFTHGSLAGRGKDCEHKWYLTPEDEK